MIKIVEKSINQTLTVILLVIFHSLFHMEPHHQIFLVSYAGRSLRGVLTFCRGAVGVFYNPNP